jgi:short-subunit dehydrogenase
MTTVRHRVALVTGASSGIGEALAAALAARGTHVVLAARTRERLEALRARIEADGGRATVLPADLAAPGAAEHVHDEVTRLGLDVDLLVNNAGFGHYGSFEEQSHEDLTDMLQVNVVALAGLTRRFVPELLARRGTVLNVASTAGMQPAPAMSAYGATKAFVLMLSESLWAEYRGRGLHVVAVCPGPVETPFIDTMGVEARGTRMFRAVLTVDDVVRDCLAALDRRSPTRIVGMRNRLTAQAARFSTRGLTARISARMLAAPAGSSGSARPGRHG